MTSLLLNEITYNMRTIGINDLQVAQIIQTSNLNTKATTHCNTYMVVETKIKNNEQTYYSLFINENSTRYAKSVAHDIHNYIVTIDWNKIYEVDFIQNFDYYMSTLAGFYDYIEFENEKYISFIPIIMMHIPEIQCAIEDANYTDLEFKVTMHGDLYPTTTEILIRFDDFIYI